MREGGLQRHTCGEAAGRQDQFTHGEAAAAAADGRDLPPRRLEFIDGNGVLGICGPPGGLPSAVDCHGGHALSDIASLHDTSTAVLYCQDHIRG